MQTPNLIIGNKNYSSWSLRPWLLLKVLDISFEETLVPLFSQGFKAQLRRYSDAAQVPVLQLGETTIWDSLAICEYINEAYPDKQAWPENSHDRAIARAVSAQMHCGFMALRNTLPMNCRRNNEFTDIDQPLQQDIDDICALWQRCLSQSKSKGGFLFGQFSIADAMFAPVVLRFNSYQIKVTDSARAYMDTVLSLPELQQWIAQGKAEPYVIEQAEI